MKKDGISYMEASNQYYADVANEKVTRADEFKTNQNYQKMRFDIIAGNTGDITMDYYSIDENDVERFLKEKSPQSYNFIKSVKNGDNNIGDYVNEK